MSITFGRLRSWRSAGVKAASDELRVDGWVAPAERFLVRVRMQDDQREIRTDESGRFVVDGLPEGFAQLSFHRIGEDGTPHDADAVVTPLFQL